MRPQQISRHFRHYDNVCKTRWRRWRLVYDITSLQWRHNERHGVSNHQRLDCLLCFRCRLKKTSKFRVTGYCAGNSPVTVEFPAQRASNAENVSIWWRNHDEFHNAGPNKLHMNWRLTSEEVYDVLKLPSYCFARQTNKLWPTERL